MIFKKTKFLGFKSIKSGRRHNNRLL